MYSPWAKTVMSGGSALQHILGVAEGSTYSLAVADNGTIWAWGDQSEGYLGNGVVSATSAGPGQVMQANGAVFSGVMSVSSRGDHTLALMNDGTVWAWGQNAFGQLGNRTTGANAANPVQVSGLSGIVALGAGLSHNLALKSDGSVWGWGFNGNASEIGAGSATAQTDLPAYVPGLSNVTAVAAFKSHYLALDGTGTLWTWDDVHPGQISDGTLISGSPTPVPVAGFSGVSLTAIACGANFNLALDNHGQVWAWGDNQYGELGSGNNVSNQTPQLVMTSSGPLTGIVSIACGARTGYALDNSSSKYLWSWGYNYDGELGNSDSGFNNTNLAAQTLSNIVSITAGTYTAGAISGTGVVSLWGFNVNSGMGGNFVPGAYTATPAAISGLTGVSALEINYYHILALTSGGISCWGLNADGQLGNGTTTTSTSFTAISGLTGVSALAASSDAYHSVIIKSDGTLWAWGDNAAGQLGIGRFGPVASAGSPTGSDSPVQVAGLSALLNGATISSLAEGEYSTVALTSTKQVLQWGDSSYQPVGFSVPVQVAELGSVGAPGISPSGGTYTSAPTITITNSLSTGTIHYTLDGTEPTDSSLAYSAPFTVSKSVLISAAVFSDSLPNPTQISPIATAQIYVADSSQTGLPGPVTGVMVSSPSSNEILVGWNLPSGITNYNQIGVYRSSDNGLTYQLIGLLAPSALSYADYGVQAPPTGGYFYKVETINDSGNSSAIASPAISPTTVPPVSIFVTAPAGPPAPVPKP